jgi:hypothetical protein
VPAADAAYCLGEVEKWGSGCKAVEPKPELVTLRLPLSPGYDVQAATNTGVGAMGSR